MSGIKKTNAMRELTAAGLEYNVLEYEFDENDLDGHHVADFLNLPYEEVFKTLVTRGESKAIYVFCLSVDDELDLKKAARVVGEKKIEMIAVKELLNLSASKSYDIGFVGQIVGINSKVYFFIYTNYFLIIQNMYL